MSAPLRATANWPSRGETLPVSQPRERRSQGRRQEEDAIVKHFTPGRIPMLLRQAHEERLHRCVDIAGALLGLVLFAPFLALSLLALRCQGSGPLFYTQIRVGAGGKLFRMYKLRTMSLDADRRKAALASCNEMDGPVFKIKNDPRVTPVGRILRKFSLDEVPQFINVLKGDMSLVGPRPPIPSEVKRYQRWHLQRLMVKPGLTGLWQVSGRNRLNFNEWVRLDIRYIRQRSLRLDISIMLRTFRVVFLRPDGT